MDMSLLLTGIGLSVLLGFVPMAIFAVLVTVFDRYEKEPFWLMLGVFAWGAIVAAGSALILNTVFGITLFSVTGNEALSSIGTAVISAPLVEETVKGLAVLSVFVYFRYEFDSLLDGVIYGSLVGFGFAATENINYIFQGFSGSGFEGLVALTLIRNGLIPFLHATLTSFTGIGFAVGRLNKGPWRYAAPVAGYLVAIGAHALHNLLASLGEITCLIGSVLDWVGFLGMFIFIIVLVVREGRIMQQYLSEEVTNGLLTNQQYHTACSVTTQLSARWGAIGGNLRGANQFYDLCGELAFKKYQLTQRGHEHEADAPAIIAKLRTELQQLKGTF